MKKKNKPADYQVKVHSENLQKKIKIPVGLRGILRRCCVAVLEYEKFDKTAEINILFVDDLKITELNNTHRGKNEPTDVLSFPLSDEKGVYEINPENGMCMLGDIVISIERALVQCREYNHTFQREICYLTVHSMFHLLGYEHYDEGVNAVIMREREEEVMQLIGQPKNSNEPSIL